jgi:hypothetical protein
MSDLEFQRELSPNQLREALLLLDGTAGVKVQKLEVGDLSPAEEVDPGADQPSTTIATQDRLPVEGPQQRTKHRNLVVFWGLGIAAAAILTLLSWSERAPTTTPPPGIAHEQHPNQPAAQLTKTASPAPAVADHPPDQSRGGSGRLASKPEVAGSSPVGHAGRDNDQAAEKDAANSASGIPYEAQTATVAAAALRQAWWDERSGRGPKKLSRHARAVRFAAERKQSWRHHWQARAEFNRGECFFFLCLPWQTRRVSYEPPRNLNQ